MSKSNSSSSFERSQYAGLRRTPGRGFHPTTWDGFFEMAGAHRQWSGQATRAGLSAASGGAERAGTGSGALYKDSWYDLTTRPSALRDGICPQALRRAIFWFRICTQHGGDDREMLEGLGSSAAISLQRCRDLPGQHHRAHRICCWHPCRTPPVPPRLMPQVGVGLCALRPPTRLPRPPLQVFLRWLTEQQRNLEFAADTGYMPVSSAALLTPLRTIPFEQQSYQRLYDVYNAMRIQNTRCPSRAS